MQGANSNIRFDSDDGIRMYLEEILKRIDKSGYEPPKWPARKFK
jgi:hypothetical protein